MLLFTTDSLIDAGFHTWLSKQLMNTGEEIRKFLSSLAPVSVATQLVGKSQLQQKLHTTLVKKQKGLAHQSRSLLQNLEDV